MKSRFSSSNSETLASEIAALAGGSRTDLTSRWRALYETEPPRRISRELLKRAIAYRLQELALGGLKPATRRLLVKVAADASARRPIALSFLGGGIFDLAKVVPHNFRRSHLRCSLRPVILQKRSS
jgi:hypothetical protein